MNSRAIALAVGLVVLAGCAAPPAQWVAIQQSQRTGSEGAQEDE